MTSIVCLIYIICLMFMGKACNMELLKASSKLFTKICTVCPNKTYTHGLINYKDTRAKCPHLKNWAVKGLCGRCSSEFPLSPSLWFNSPPFPVWISTYTVFKYTVCKGRGCKVLGLRQINARRTVPLQVHFCRWHILHWFLRLHLSFGYMRNCAFMY